MTRSELVSIIANHNPHLLQQDVEHVIDVILKEISEALATGKRIELRGFGIFSTKNRAARLARNPKKNTLVPVEEKWIPVFKIGKNLNCRLNPIEKE